MKANSNQSVLRTLAKLGAGADVVSGGELKRALAAGIPPQKILFSGVGKTEAELRAALAADILCINVEVRARARTAVAACESKAAAPRASRCASIRMSMPARTPRSRPASPRTSSAFRSRSARGVYARAAKLPGISVTGIDMHIGSQITDLAPMETAFRHSGRIRRTLRADGHDIAHVDFGGGLGIPYYRDREAPPAPDAYAAMVKRVTHNLGCTLMFEPGRMIVGNAGILVAK